MQCNSKAVFDNFEKDTTVLLMSRNTEIMSILLRRKEEKGEGEILALAILL